MKKSKTKIFRPTTSKSGVFLLELVLVILFFSIASTVCIEMFVKSYTISNDSTYLNTSVQIAENIAETFKAENDLITHSFSETYYYSDDLKQVSKVNSTYIAVVDYSSDNSMNHANISVFANETNYFTLPVNKYIPNGKLISSTETGGNNP
jgi:Tfp pilus assembly protein PilV